MTSRTVELITIGDELMLGFTIDTNAAFLARRLAELGIVIARRATVGDDIEIIVAAVREALDRTGAVITTGGLGPTSDDLTRQAVAQVFGRDLVVDEVHLAWMRERWRARFGRELPESNTQQALLPEGAVKLENRHGSAPGALLRDDAGRFAVLLPGVPRELRGMTDDALFPLLREMGWGGANDPRIESLTLRTTGIAESLLQDQLREVTRKPPFVGADGALPGTISLAYLPGMDGVDLRLTNRSAVPGPASALADAAASVRAVLGRSIYGEADEDLARVVLARCRARGLKLSVAESCTGGLLGARITAIPGSSDVFVGGMIAYSNSVKIRELRVDESSIERDGAVSETVVRQMAVGARDRLQSGISLAITGIAGPDGGTAEKPVGLVWVCVAIGDRVEPRRLQLWGDRQEIRYRAAQAALEVARRLLEKTS